MSIVSSLTSRPVRTDLYDTVLELERQETNPKRFSEIDLKGQTTYDDGSVWRIYRYEDPESDHSMVFPVYYPEGLPD